MFWCILCLLGGAFLGSTVTFMTMCFTYAIGDREDKKNESKADDNVSDPK